LNYRIISIGTCSQNRLWGESSPVRTTHATTTLVEDDDRAILVDPSLPAPMLEAKFFERTGKRLADVTDVFLTTLRPTHRRALSELQHASWWVNQPEVDSYREHLEGLLESGERLEQEDVAGIREDLKIVARCQPAPERFASQVQLYPLPGPSVGSAGLVLTPATQTIIIAGDAVLTVDHFQAGQVWEGCADTEAAQESFQDVYEVADVVVPGHDNLLLRTQNWL
jgi:glyoxylase-like metal-dependent hydrolase (beta-lactamase superfamily II)